jgi:sulfite exporter TauE/SafE/copper chaperone CopZ
MHCLSCERLLDSEFHKLNGFQSAKFDRKNDSAEIEYDQTILPFEKIQEKAHEFGYAISEIESDKNTKPLLSKAISSKKINSASFLQWLNAIVIVAIILFLYRIFQNLGFLDKINLNGEGISFGVAFLVGIVASLSTCLAVVGAVVIAFSEKYGAPQTKANNISTKFSGAESVEAEGISHSFVNPQSKFSAKADKNEGRNFYDSAVKPNALFHIGRIATFFFLGGILGIIGGEINISGNFISIFTIVVSAVMAWLGLNILGFIPNITKFGIRMPMFLTSKWNDIEKSEHKLAPFILGGLTFFLPCGFTQSMQILALTSGSFLTGGLILAIFSLGTVPVLITLGITASWARNKKMVVFQKVAGILVIIFAVFTFNSAMALRGVKTSVISSDNNISNNNKSISENKSVSDQQNYQVVNMKITSSGFEPNVLKIKSGVPVKWIINGDQATGCTSRIIVPSMNISKSIVSGENVVTFTPASKGDLNFSCGMGMVRGKFVVE